MYHSLWQQEKKTGHTAFVSCLTLTNDGTECAGGTILLPSERTWSTIMREHVFQLLQFSIHNTFSTSFPKFCFALIKLIALCMTGTCVRVCFFLIHSHQNPSAVVFCCHWRLKNLNKIPALRQSELHHYPHQCWVR